MTVVNPAYSKGAGSRDPETVGHASKATLHHSKNWCLVGLDSTVTEIKLVTCDQLVYYSESTDFHID